MANITLKGNPIETLGDLPEIGAQAPDFTLIKTDLSELTLADLKGQKVVLNIFPSLDTPVCAASVRRFNQDAAAKEGVTVVSVSADLPFAHGRFCTTEGIEGVVSGSTFRSSSFGEGYGVTITTGPLAGLLSRAVVILDGEGKVIYTEQVPEIVDEPNYDKALAAL